MEHGVPYDIMSKDGKKCQEMTANHEVLYVLEDETGEVFIEDDDDYYYEEEDDDEDDSAEDENDEL